MPVFQLIEDLVFPPPHLAREDGLLAVGGDLSRERLLLAYRMGIFPWYGDGDPILWWSPDPRLVLLPQELHVSRRLRRVLQKGTFEVTMDTAFDQVVQACASMRYPGREGTWITPEMAAAYCKLHQSGYGHSVECRRAGRLVGGLYGLSLGKCFFGESMFSHEPNASKVALAALVQHVAAWDFSLIDCQITSGHLLTLGAREMPRTHFLRMLEQGLKADTRVGKWSLD